MKLNTKGIRFQLIVGMLLLTISGIWLIGILAVKAVEISALYTKMYEAERLAKVVNVMFVSPDKLSAGFDEIRSAARILTQGGVRDFEFYNAQGKVIFKEGSINEDDGEVLPLLSDITATRIGGDWLNLTGDSLRVTVRQQGIGIPKGKLRFMFPLDDIRRQTSQIRDILVGLTILDSAVIVIAGIFMFSRGIINPIRTLNETATRIAGGAFGERTEVGVDNEIGSLAKSFNTMAERIESEIRALESTNIELVSTQEELLRTSTLAAVGNLAAGIAHEVGNPLQAVRGYVDLLSSGSFSAEERQEILKRASSEVSRIDTIVREFLEVARPSRWERALVDVNEMVAEIISTTSVLDDFSGIKTEFKRQKLPQIMTDGGKFRQVLVNLLINAAHSMEGMTDAAIRIETFAEKRADTKTASARAGRRKDDPIIDIRQDPPESDFVCVRVADTGCGISAEDAEKIFDPFFTTKGAGKGTGLGLFVSRSIVNAYGGDITLSSVKGKGSVFTVAMPVVKPDKGAKA